MVEVWNSHELAFLIQEGGAKRPELRELVVRRFAPQLYWLAFDLLPPGPDRGSEALAHTYAAIRAALDNTEELQRFTSPMTWLCATLLTRFIPPGRKLFRQAKSALPRAVYLRTVHGFDVDQIAEILAIPPERAAQALAKHRKRVRPQRPPGPNHPIDEIHRALDDLLPVQALLDNDHLRGCELCREYIAALQEADRSVAEAICSARPAPLQEEQVQAILELLSRPDALSVRQRRSLGTRELAWAAGAGLLVLVVFRLLNPLWTTEPDPPAPPTPPPSLALPEPAAAGSYTDLGRSLIAASPPHWGESSSFAIEPDEPPSAMVLSPEGRFTAYIIAGRQIGVCAVHAASCYDLVVEGAEFTTLAFSGEERLAAGSAAGILRIWDLANRFLLRYEVDGFSGPIRALAFSETQEALAVATDADLSLWRFEDDSISRYLIIPAAGIQALAFSPDGSRLAAIEDGTAVSVFDGQLQQLDRFAGGLSGLASLSFSPDGLKLAVGAAVHKALLIEFDATQSGAIEVVRVREFLHPGPVVGFGWSRDGRFLMAAAATGREQVYLWDVETGLPAALPLAVFEDPTGRSFFLYTAGLSIDGELITIQYDGPDFSRTPPTQRVTVQNFLPGQAAAGPAPSEYLQAVSDLFILDAGETLPAGARGYPLSLADAAARIALPVDLADVIPNAFRFAGASYEPYVFAATFVYTTTIAPNRTETVTLQIRPDSGADRLGDWVGASASIEHFQIGAVLGERVDGQWLQAQVDGGASGIYRWSPDGLSRFRWRQGGYLFEIASASDSASPAIRWWRLFQPLAYALISAGETEDRFTYLVQEGDTCTAIAGRFGTTIGRLTGDNALDADCTIYAGQELIIPVPPAVELAAEQDLNCDDFPERLRTIPDPLRPSSGAYFGLTLEAVPEGSAEPDAGYAAFWTFSVGDVDVDFFGAPVVFQQPGDCRNLIAVSGYGGSGEDSGLRIFAWDGEVVIELLHSTGFPEGDLLAALQGALEFSTGRLRYDTSVGACYLETTSYAWLGGMINQTGREITTGLPCFSEPNP